MNKKLATFESDTAQELEKIKVELEEVRTISSPQEPAVASPAQFSISIDKAIYPKSGTIIVTAHNILPQKEMSIQLISSFNELITSTTTRADSTGKLSHVFQIPSFAAAGDYKIKATTSDGSADIMFFKISDDTIPTPTKAPTTGLSVILDKPFYNPGDMIKITGFAEASTGITAEITSPTAQVSSAHSTTSSDNTYTLIFILDSDAREGNWKLKVIQGEHEETLTFTVKN